MSKKISLISALAVMLGFFASLPVSAGVPLSITSVGLYSLNGAPGGLSGLTYAGGNQYYAVEDSGARLHPLTINLNSVTGAVTSASLGTSITLSGTDLEGVAYNAANNSVYVSDETGATIKEYNLSGGWLSTVSVPTVYSSYRNNYSLESLSLQAGHKSLWTANEEALYEASVVNDGPLSTTSAGTVVRLQKFDSNLNAVRQWAYVTEPILSYSGLTITERSGVSDLCVLPNGKLLVLERQLNGEGVFGFPEFHNYIYEVDLTTGTDVSGFTSGLAGETYTAVAKNLLWDSSFGMDNFEGMALGPQLDNGEYSLLLISDGDGDPNESLYALRLGGTIPEPATFALLLSGAGLMLLLVAKTKRKDCLAAK